MIGERFIFGAVGIKMPQITIPDNPVSGDINTKGEQMHRTHFLIAVLVMTATALVSKIAVMGMDAKDSVFQKKGCPLIAVWCDYENESRMESDAPYLRVAIWEDGEVIYAKDPDKWGHSLQAGQIAPYRIKLLKKALLETGIFELKGNCYLVPDASTYCITLNVGNKQRTLYWDECESPNYGININPKPQHIEFKKCWKALNSLALVACPDQFTESKERFAKPPQSWYAEPSIQSK